MSKIFVERLILKCLKAEFANVVSTLMKYPQKSKLPVWLCLLLCAVQFSAFSSAAQSSETANRGEFFGAIETTHPDWFKESFLDFEEDIDEAAAAGRRLVLYFHQDGCPYCNVLVEDNFKNPSIVDFMQANFDLVAINMWGDREVIQVGGQSFTEKTLAAALNVDFTPTLLFFSEAHEVVFRLDGYRPPDQFTHVLHYVAERKENELTYAEYLASTTPTNQSMPLGEPGWPVQQLSDLSQHISRPLIVLFEEPDCEPCNLLHGKTFKDENAASILQQFTVVRYNRWSDDRIARPDGTTSTISQWAQDLGLGFAPAIVLYDGETRVMTLDAMFKTFHVLGALEYVASGTYKHETSFQRYLSERAEQIRDAGQDVDIWRY